MAQRPARPCSQPGCPALVTREARCPTHERAHEASDRQRRGSATQRGYGKDWQEVSRPYLKANPWCARCQREGRGQVQARVVGHKVAIRDGGERMNPRNWESLCVSCNTKQAHDDGAYSQNANPKTERGKMRFLQGRGGTKTAPTPRARGRDSGFLQSLDWA
jgi:5-methylcytosine-specific restriction protein A